ncbi:type I-C CRISPR-associated protein Cas8c/Csd1 [Desulfofustis limnaeus]|jgi:CRISPR-associated protein Csd1|uniref:Type I-C CRISPR-associated protein Cas8c/Csd1 n=1 Tax=Desulfofustis limnaeus TaxID=2740163 RepID=A0ABM7WCB5_9BACT|nr:type I-C CRISPR-associated protein Cas8c/Csd1 [Desulfofustis limnaeus]MDY0040028.1 type I-C CRISPR-associated protein Cas8c/Csd1 [Desulforhabdus sp.]BDD88556.1 type I-C CRISPR-associated protein Cas8c/Csd1 [Desulfofustis limnaeus]
MILQALTAYYKRLAAEGTAVSEGFKRIEIPFLIILNMEGEFVGLQDTRVPHGRKLVAQSFLIPTENERQGSKAWQKTNFLWDHYGYVLGWPKTENKKDKEMARKQHETFVAETKMISTFCTEDKAVEAVCRFVVSGNFDAVFNHRLWKDCSKISGCNLTFQIENQIGLVCQRDSIKAFISKGQFVNDEDEQSDCIREWVGFCLVTGETGPIARLHPRTPVVGSKSGAKIVSFQKNMGFDSYGKIQSYNAPTCKKAAFAYTTALNEMLSKKSRQKIFVGDATTVFWAAKKNDLEDVFADIFGEPAKENPEQANKAIRILYEAPKAGVPPLTEDYTRFFVLGLAPNAARIAVRFWHVGTVGETAQHILQHFEDCKVVHGPKQPEYLSLFRLLVSTALQGKSENIPANLAGEFMKAILAGTPYPHTLLAAVIRRCRAEREVTYPRAALLKAVLARAARFYKHSEQEVGMALDTGNSNIGYRLGRLFATLEKIQEEANPGINATIRDRFYGAASGTPVAAFPHLMKLKNHHLAKLGNRGRAVNLEKVITEIMDAIVDFPTHLSLQDQGRFAVGYYHQRQVFFTKNTNN